MLVEADGELSAQRDAPVGGQAVLEGVMMRGVANWAVAVRKPSAEQLAEGELGPEEAAQGEIEVTTLPLDSAMRRHRILRLPILRGVVALGGSMAIGFRALEVSANAQLPPEEQAEESDAESAEGSGETQEIPRAVWAGTVVVAVVLAIVLFFLIPVGLTSLIKNQLGSSVLFWVVEGLIRTTLFLGYMRCSRACATCAACSSTTAPSTRRSPASRRGCRSRPSTPSASRGCIRAAARASCWW